MALPLLLPACERVEQSWLCEREEKSSWVDVHTPANPNPWKAQPGKSVDLGPLGCEYRLRDRECSHQSPEISREALAY